jgi:hypothetical protein
MKETNFMYLHVTVTKVCFTNSGLKCLKSYRSFLQNMDIIRSIRLEVPSYMFGLTTKNNIYEIHLILPEKKRGAKIYLILDKSCNVLKNFDFL